MRCLDFLTCDVIFLKPSLNFDLVKFSVCAAALGERERVKSRVVSKTNVIRGDPPWGSSFESVCL